jgi:hypothetical protein
MDAFLGPSGETWRAGVPSLRAERDDLYLVEAETGLGAEDWEPHRFGGHEMGFDPFDEP